MTDSETSKVRVAIAGVGNCASSLVQAVTAAREMSTSIGIMHDQIGPYSARDIQIVAAFDIDGRKVGSDLAVAIHAEPNCTTRYYDVPTTGVTVRCGPLADGIGTLTAPLIKVVPEANSITVPAVAEALGEAEVDVLVCYLPVGAAKATASYAAAALQAEVAFVNCNPELIASDPAWQQLFTERGVPLLGDDMKSQLGATTLHRMLIDMCSSRGAIVDRTYQLNVGGNTDFLNMRDPQRAASKKTSKMSAIGARLSDAAEFGAGPSDYVPYLDDHKVAYISLEGRSLLGMPFTIEAKLAVEDSPNSAAITIDAVRAAKVARDRGLAGPINDACAFLFKTPPEPCSDTEAARRIDQFSAPYRQD